MPSDYDNNSIIITIMHLQSFTFTSHLESQELMILFQREIDQDFHVVCGEQLYRVPLTVTPRISGCANKTPS